jgi:hypothetical protein
MSFCDSQLIKYTPSKQTPRSDNFPLSEQQKMEGLIRSSFVKVGQLDLFANAFTNMNN